MTSEWLTRALEESRARGFLGPGEIEPHVEHARGFLEAWRQYSPAPPTAFLDLGSGGGLPGLVLLEELPCRGVLLDSMAKRVAFLREVLTWVGAPSNGEVVEGRAEDLARSEALEESVELVTARSFATPAATAECAARFLVVGGRLIVSEPPGAPPRWDERGLSLLGLERGDTVTDGHTYQVIEKVAPTPALYPRRSGVPGKRPLF